MERRQVEETFNDLVLKEQDIRLTKGKEYAGDKDILHNFKSIGEEVSCPHCGKQIGPKVVFWIYFKKHIDSLRSYINNGKALSESIISRINDIRNYAGLFACIVEDEKGTVVNKEVERKEEKDAPYGKIILSKYERQSGSNRVQWAEDLIRQLPVKHDGRNTWLLNYGQGEEARKKREKKGLAFDLVTQSAETTGK